MRPHNQFIQDTIYHYSQNAIEQNNLTIYEDDRENDEMKAIFESDENCTKDSCSTINSISDEESDESPELEPKETISARLNTLINILKDDCFKTDNIINVNRPIKPDITIKDEKPKIPRMNWEIYHRLDVIHSFMDDLEYDYPSICTTGVIGKSVEGRDLKILKISNSDSTNSSVWIDAGIHAREWIAPAVATYVANHIVKNFNDMPPSVTSKDWYFLPVVNPDGYEYSHTVDRMWRKSRSWYGGECVGVDLNRNFSCGWGGKGSSGNPTNVFYRGPEPFSEPESSAVRAIYDSNGNTYKVGISRDVMYGASGTSNDFSYGVAGIPYCYLIELRTLVIWKEERSTMDIMVERSRAGQVAGMLHEREIPYSVAIADVGLMISRERGGTSTKIQSPTLTSTRSPNCNHRKQLIGDDATLPTEKLHLFQPGLLRI
ncbi:unnamed protein product [Diatraea saccharalis]|uniref:Peptidase M14 domain-containing protein n=1 Tax=Diatraea saccharalis TaxID=40085 RepID=A0A9N9WDQ1_9NEOP|nr:unnamed protein product [Diatraea saccharalis]